MSCTCFHLDGHRQAVRFGTYIIGKFKIENICLHRDSNQPLLAFQPGALEHSAMLTVVEMSFKLLHYLDKINTHENAGIKLIMVGCVLKVAVRQNRYFFYKCRCTTGVYYC